MISSCSVLLTFKETCSSADQITFYKGMYVHRLFLLHCLVWIVLLANTKWPGKSIFLLHAVTPSAIGKVLLISAFAEAFCIITLGILFFQAPQQLPVLVDFSVNISLVIKSHEKWSGFCWFIFFFCIYNFSVLFVIALFFFVLCQFNYFIVFCIHLNNVHLVKMRNIVLLINGAVAVI